MAGNIDRRPVVASATLLVALLMTPSAQAAPPVSIQVSQGAWRLSEVDNGWVDVSLEVVNQGPGEAANAIVVLAPGSASFATTPALAAQKGLSMMRWEGDGAPQEIRCLGERTWSWPRASC